MEILLLVILIILNGVFAMSEIALVTARPGRLAGLANEGDKAAAAAIRLGEEPTRFLSTLQIGITSISILNGIVGEAVLARPLALWLISLGLDVEWSGIAATALVVLVITYVSIVIGELVPKRIGQLHPEGIARLVARPMQGLAIAARPFVLLLSISTDTLLRLLGIRSDRLSAVTEEDIHALLKEGSDSGAIEHHEHQMVRNLFRLDDRALGSLMIPRADIDYLDINKPLEENLKYISESEHSRFPVCRGGLDDVLGVMPAKQILIQLLKNGTVNLESKLQSQVFVPDSMTGAELLAHFRATGTQMVLVVDEYGEVEGLVTLQDVLEAVIGEFRPRTQDQAWALQRQDGSWLLDGLIPVPELKDKLNIKRVPEEEKRYYHTLSGMMMQLLDRLPTTGDIAEWENWRFEVVDMDGKRIDKVMASRLEIPETIQPSED